jgi:hypothetical protein
MDQFLLSAWVSHLSRFEFLQNLQRYSQLFVYQGVVIDTDDGLFVGENDTSNNISQVLMPYQL